MPELRIVSCQRSCNFLGASEEKQTSGKVWKMTGFHLVILFALSYVLIIPCEGKITSPPDRTEVTILPGSSMNIAWTFDNPSTVTSRSWYFTSYSGLVQNELIAQITGFGTQVRKDILPGLDLIEPATLSLSKVNQSYDGTYRFSLAVNTQITPIISGVIVYIAKKPNVTFNCSRSNDVNEGDDFTCVCRGEGGRPPANVTWSKDGKQIGGIGKENQSLTLSNVNGTHNGTYNCKAESYPSDEYIDEKYIQVTVIPNSAPKNTNIMLKPERVKVGEEVVIECTSHGVPEPSYKITHIDTKTVRNVKTFTISAKLRDNGTYECIAWNKLGNDSDSGNLIVVGQITPTRTISGPSTTQATSSPTSSTTVRPTPTPPPPPPPFGLIIGIIVGVLVLIIIVVVVYCYKSKQKERNNSCANIDPVPGNGHELEEPGPSDGAYDTVWPVGTSGSKSKAPVENALPPVYAAVDKNNREGNTLYASLDDEALKSSRASKKEPDRPQQTEYASIDFAKTGNAPKAV